MLNSLYNVYIYNTFKEEVVLEASKSDDATAWLKSKGFDTTLDQVQAEWINETENSLKLFTGTLNTYLNGKITPNLPILDGVVKLNDEAVVDPLFQAGMLTWSSTKNTSNRSISLLNFDRSISGDVDTASESTDLYVRAHFKGVCWTTDPQPSQFNLHERQGIFTLSFIEKLATKQSTNLDLPVGPSSITQWADTYSIYDNASNEWKTSSEQLVIGNDGNVRYGDALIHNHSFNNEVLSWNVSDGNSFNMIIMMRRVDHPTADDSYIGNQFISKKWSPDEAVPKASNVMGLVGSLPDINNTAKNLKLHARIMTFVVDGSKMGAGMALVYFRSKLKDLAGSFLRSSTEKLIEWAKTRYNIAKKAYKIQIQTARLDEALEAGKEGARLAGQRAEERARKAREDAKKAQRGLERQIGEEKMNQDLDDAGKQAQNEKGGAEADKSEQKRDGEDEGESSGWGKEIEEGLEKDGSDLL